MVGELSSRRDGRFLEAVFESLPAHVVVVDAMGTISFATARGAAFLGTTVDELVGRSVLDLVTHDTAWAYAAGLALATDYPDLTLGPLRVELVGGDGSIKTADLWARNELDDPVVAGIVCLLTEETAAMGLAEAMASVAEGAPFLTVAAQALSAMAGHPVVAPAALVHPAGDGTWTTLVDTGVPNSLAALPDDGPWKVAAQTGIRQLHDVEDLPPAVAEGARAAGFHAAWCEPVPPGTVPAEHVLVVWRHRPGNPSPNQVRSTFQAASILGLAMASASVTAQPPA